MAAVGLRHDADEQLHVFDQQLDPLEYAVVLMELRLEEAVLQRLPHLVIHRNAQHGSGGEIRSVERFPKDRLVVEDRRAAKAVEVIVRGVDAIVKPVLKTERQAQRSKRIRAGVLLATAP